MKNNIAINPYSNISLEEGAGGKKSEELISSIRKIFKVKSKWKNTSDDGAVLDFISDLTPTSPRPSPSKGEGVKRIVFTSDSFIVDPIFFPGGDIGKIAICGTLNDLAVMGAVPLGISLSLIIEEGFSRADLIKIMQSINAISELTKVPIVTGDTKVTEKGKIDKIAIVTSGVGAVEKVIENSGVKVGDAIIASGNLGEHAVALLAKRFNYQTKIKSDCQPVIQEIQSVAQFLNSAKDPTRGGVSAVLNEMADKSKVKITLQEKNLPFGKETVAVSGLLGIDKFSFPSEGRFVASVASKDAQKVLKILQKFNSEAKVIGRVEKGRGVFLETEIGSVKKIEIPTGKLIPRIC